MSYQALYRKFRPGSFDEVRGQEHIVTTLKNQIQSDHVGHAYLFCGTRGTGKTTVAKIFARAVNCEKPGEDGPCGECDMCRAISAGNSMNVVEMDAASNNKVDDIRQVIEEVQYSPPQGKYKVYIIDEVHMLTTSAFNALLKTLEEPPSYLIFILATTEVHKIPLTILSRCQRYDFKRIRVETIASRLREVLDREGIGAEERALTYIARMADGALRDGLSLLEQCVSFYFGEELTYEKVLKVLGTADNEVYAAFAADLARCDVAGMMGRIDDIIAGGKDLTRFCSEFIWYMRNVMLAKNTEHPENVIDMSAENLGLLKGTAESLELEMIFRYIRVLSEVENQMKYSDQKRVLFELALIRLCKPEMERDYESIVSRLHNLEEKIKNGAVAVENAQAAPAGAVQPEETVEKKKISVSAVPEEVKKLTGNWQQVLNLLDPVSRNMLNHVTLTVDEKGSLLVAFSENTSYSYFAGEANRDILPRAAGEVLGKEVSVELKLVTNPQEYDALPELRRLFSDSDIPIESVD